MREMIEAALLSVALAGRIYEAEPTRFADAVGALLAALEKTRFNRDSHCFGETDTDKATRRQRVPGTNELGSGARRTSLAVSTICARMPGRVAHQRLQSAWAAPYRPRLCQGFSRSDAG